MLTQEQIAQYDRDGFIVLKGLFDADEVARLQAAAEHLRTPQRAHPDANVIEKDGVSIRAAWAVELDSPECNKAMRIEKVFGPVKQLLGERVYLFQSRLNYKVAGKGDVFQWHQDYASWFMDGVPEGGHRDMLTALVMLDDTTSESGPLRFVPGSHKEGMIDPIYDTWTTSYPLHIVPDETVKRLSDGSGIVECVGPAGTVVLFCGNLVHGSSENRSPRDRRNLYFAYNRDNNRPVSAKSRRQHKNPYIVSPTSSALDVLHAAKI
ncbi:MAG: phytanoyl-CoA dioxygenase family protein [Proteobacteria bacterium]|nr:phytanoyl-CoA dioxygenase family protein [Pseudomonadota bacterium]